MTGTRWYTVAAVVAATAVLLAFLYAVRNQLPPFLIAFAVAWLLDPVLDRLQRRGVRRFVAVLGIYGVFLIVFVAGIFYLVPAVIDQAKQFGEDFPRYSLLFQKYASGLMSHHHDTLIRLKLPTTVQEVFSKYGDQLNAQVGVGVNAATRFITSTLSKALWIVLIPIIAFYALMDIDRMRKKAVLLIPEAARPRATEVLSRVGTVFSNYVRGQVVVCILFGVATTITLEVFGLKYGIILGLLSGVLYAVPYLGAIVTTLLVFLVGLATYPHGVSQAIWPTVVTWALNQLIFDPIVTPKVVGKSVGLHPILSLFALLSGGQLFGLVGMILAVPVAASIQEVVYEFCPQLKPDPKPARRLRKRRKQPAAAE